MAGRSDRAAENHAAGSPFGGSAAGLPARYTPRIAGYARGPMLEVERVTPTDWRWRRTRTYMVRATDGLDYRAVRVTDERTGEFAGYWAVELLGTPLSMFEEDGDGQD